MDPSNDATGRSYTADCISENTDYARQVRNGFGNMETVWFYLSVEQSNA